jgi:hypothetical protein
VDYCDHREHGKIKEDHLQLRPEVQAGCQGNRNRGEEPRGRGVGHDLGKQAREDEKRQEDGGVAAEYR